MGVAAALNSVSIRRVGWLMRGGTSTVVVIMDSPTRAPSASTGARSDESGPEANSRLTSVTGILLLLMLAVEGYTILDVRGLITLHIFLGVLLVGPVLLKVASTLYRFARYYTGSAAYVRRGAPHLVLRVLGPFVTLTSLAVLGTGLGLLAVRPGHEGLLLTAHKASFILWFAVMTVHVLGHLREALVNSWREVSRLSAAHALRLSVVAAALVLGVGLAAAVWPSAAPWVTRGPGTHAHRDGSGQHRGQ